jgi:hypothetical protein
LGKSYLSSLLKYQIPRGAFLFTDFALASLSRSIMSETSDPRIYRPHVARNREPIRDVLRRVLPPEGLVLEVASGSGEHIAYFAGELPALTWQPTDPDGEALASIAAHRAAIDAANLLPPLRLDVTAEQWPVARAEAVLCINMIHISRRPRGCSPAPPARWAPVASSISTVPT